MDIATWVWPVTLVGLTAVLLADFVATSRRLREPALRECVGWVALYVTLALGFGVIVWLAWGGEYAAQFYVGWLTEYSLSVDNLFVFVIIMSRFAVPRPFQQWTLGVGIALALLLRGVFIATGALLVERFTWIFYVFGVFLLWTAWKLVRHGEDDESDFRENIVVRASRRLLRISRDYDGVRLTTRVGGRRRFTPMLVVLLAIGTTDLIFALDSIPAIFGLTQEPYLIITANVFALMGLRQMYFLLGGLLDRLTYLSVGLSVVLGFIGVKLVLEALHANNVPFINGGEPVSWAPEVPIWLSLCFIAATLLATAVVSIIASRRQARRQQGASAVLDAGK